MQNRDKTVIGSYSNQNEAMEKVQSLKLEGYRKEDIIVYSKNRTDDRVENDATAIQATDEDYTDDNKDDTRSAWDKIKDAFTPDSYDYDTRKEEDSYDESEDILYPYRDDIKKGNTVIVVQNFRGEDKQDFDSRGGGFVNQNRVDNPEVGIDDPLTDGRDFDRANDMDNQTRN